MKYRGENKKKYFIFLVMLLFLGCENSTKNQDNNINGGNADINHLEENSSLIDSNVTETNTSETLNQIEVFDINNTVSKETSVGKVSIPFKRNDSVERVELIGNDSKKFTISLDGTIYTKEQLVAISQKLIKKERVYDFKVKITYRSRKIVYINIKVVAYEHIAVEDREDAPPVPTSPIIVNINKNVAPIFTSPTTINANENQTSAITLTATDSNGDTLSYSISGTDANSFNIDSSTGIVTFKVEADYETQSSYSFTASVSDGIEVTTQTVTITIIPALIKNSILKDGYTIKETTRGSYVIKNFSSYIGNTTIEEESKLGYITLSDYGAVGDGVSDDTASLKEALNQSRVQNKPLYIPNGIYKITEIISIESGDYILGADKAVI